MRVHEAATPADRRRFIHLKELGVGDDRLEEMARKATDCGSVGNFVKRDAKEVVEIHKLAR